jgi:prepilin-type N-terminal cleavage/methylation domain-containing protein
MISLKSNGFTLIEALVTVALISILSSFAFSNYKEQMVWAN